MACSAPCGQYRGFILGSVRREFQARYQQLAARRGVDRAQPLAMIVVYTVIFSQVMRARLPGVDSSLRLQHLPLRGRL